MQFTKTKVSSKKKSKTLMPDSHPNRRGGNGRDIKKQTWQISARKACVKRSVSEKYRKAATHSDFFSAAIMRQTYLCAFVWLLVEKSVMRNARFRPQTLWESQELGLDILIEVNIRAKAAGGFRTKRLGFVYFVCFQASSELFALHGLHRVSCT